jgi:O-methyltransferase
MKTLNQSIKILARSFASSLGYKISKVNREDERSIEKASQLYEKYRNYTMVPQNTFIDNLKLCDRFRHIEGSIVECGVWRGGTIAAIAELLGNRRKYYLFDSFEGLPNAQKIDGEAALEWQNNQNGIFYHNNCKADIEEVYKALQLAKIDNFEIFKGWFSETLLQFDKTQKIAILRLDADWYESTYQCLSYLYPQVTKGGITIVDDYYAWDGCARAIYDYFSEQGIQHRIYQLGENCYIIKK